MHKFVSRTRFHELARRGDAEGTGVPTSRQWSAHPMTAAAFGNSACQRIG
jgi:hypothetical protein